MSNPVAINTPTVPTNTMSQTTIKETDVASSSSTYASTTKTIPRPIFPKKDQAIVIHAEDTLKLYDYVKAIGDIIEPKNINFASRISNNRICIYLSSTRLVEELITTHPTLQINNMTLTVRRLISPTKRILISNISPSIPHDLAEKALKQIGLQLASPISFLKAGIPGDEYGHILSFRRQVFIHSPTSDFELQTSLVISFEEVDHRIFLSTDKMECFLCKQTGHIASNCPVTPNNNVIQPNNSNEPQNSLSNLSPTVNPSTDDLQIMSKKEPVLKSQFPAINPVITMK